VLRSPADAVGIAQPAECLDAVDALVGRDARQRIVCRIFERAGLGLGVAARARQVGIGAAPAVGDRIVVLGRADAKKIQPCIVRIGHFACGRTAPAPRVGVRRFVDAIPDQPGERWQAEDEHDPAEHTQQATARALGIACAVGGHERRLRRPGQCDDGVAR
jgi:hypothetical protein